MYMNQYTHEYDKLSSCKKNACFMDLTEFHRNYIISELIQKINFE